MGLSESPRYGLPTHKHRDVLWEMPPKSYSEDSKSHFWLCSATSSMLDSSTFASSDTGGGARTKLVICQGTLHTQPGADTLSLSLSPGSELCLSHEVVGLKSGCVH